jgi:hypothetical protein
LDFEKIISENPHLIESLISKKVDPHFFADPLALHVSFDPINSGGRENHTYSLVKLKSGDLKFIATNFEISFVKIIFIISFFTTIYFILAVFRPDILSKEIPQTIETYSWIKIFFSAAFLMGSLNEIFTLRNQTRISQKDRKIYLRGKKSLSFDSIHAVQFLLEYCPDKSNKHPSHYLSFETNLVLKNKERFHLMDQGGYLTSLMDAQKIASALKVPIWDAVKARIKTKEVIIK